MTRLTILLVPMVLAAGAASAQMDPSPDGIGLFFDFSFAVRCDWAPSGCLLPMYLVASNISCPDGIAGWEAMVEHSPETGPLMYLSTVLAGDQPVNLHAAPEFHVTLNTPLPYAPNILLATLNYFVLSPASTYLYIKPIAHPQIVPGQACYADGADLCHLVPFVPPLDSWDMIAACLNCPCSAGLDLPARADAKGAPAGPALAPGAEICWNGQVAVEAQTWGAVKAIYR